MNIAIAGGSGFVGKHLTDALTKKGHHIYILTRSPNRYTNTNSITYIGWLKSSFHPEKELPRLDGIINLAGDSLFGYWTKAKKERILTSRIHATKQLINLISKMDRKPEVFINASAIGFYGTSETDIFTEQTTEPGNDFLARVTDEWELPARQAEALGVRTVRARIGVILGDGGALPKMSLPFKGFIGGRIGSGEQWMSWIHIDDVVGLFSYILTNENIEGPVNITAPNPIRNKDFSKILAQVLNRPYWLHVPSTVMERLLGEMSLLLLEGQYVIPDKALIHNYVFQYPTLKASLRNIF